MSFYLETTDMDLGDTSIENIFINDFMPMANGTFVKVYLLGYKYAYDRDENIEITNQKIAKHLNIPLEDVLGAWDFWEEKGIIEKIIEDSDINYKIKFLNLKQLYIQNNLMAMGMETKKTSMREKADQSINNIIQANKVKEINQMFNNIDHIMRRQTNPSEKEKIIKWITDFNMNTDVIEKAFFYGVEQKGVKKLYYIEGIIRNWYDEGLTNMEDLMAALEKKDKENYKYLKIMSALGLGNRPLRQEEKDIISTWFSQYGYDLNIILKACEQDKNPIPSVKYVNGIIKSWHTKGINKVEDIEVLDKREEKEPSKPVKSTVKNIKATRFHNFDQRSTQYTSDELEEIARKKRRKYLENARASEERGE